MPLPVSGSFTVPATVSGGSRSMPDLPAFKVVPPSENLKVEDFRLPDGTPLVGKDGYLVPPAREFSMVVNAATRIYSYRFDEAMRDNWVQARSMRRDAFIRGLLEERILPTINRRWQLDVENDRDPSQRAVRDSLTKIVEALPQFDCFKRALLDGVWYGRAGTQWNYWRNPEVNDLWSIRKWDPVHGDSIQFTYDGVPAILMDAMTAGWYSANGATQGQWGDIRSTDRGGMALVLQRPTWRKRFAIHQHIREKADYFEGELAGSVQGLGLRGLVYWHYQIRTEALTWMLAYMQSVGQMDMLIFNYPWGNDAAKAQQQANANKIIGKAAFIVPRNPQGNWNAVEQLSMNDAGLKALHDLISEYFDRHIERLIVGQSMSSGADNDSGLGGSGRAAFAQATKDEILVYDTNRLDEVMTSDVIKPLKEYNFKWAKFPVRFKSVLPNLEADKKVASGKTMVELKVPIRMDELREAAGFSRPEEGDEVVQPPPDPNAGPMGGMPGAPTDPNAPPGQPGQPQGTSQEGQPQPAPQQEPNTDWKPTPPKPEGGFGPSFNSRMPVNYVTDAHGNEHKGSGPGGGQFTGSGSGNGPSSAATSQPETSTSTDQQKVGSNTPKRGEPLKVGQKGGLHTKIKAPSAEAEILSRFTISPSALKERVSSLQSHGFKKKEALETILNDGLLEQFYQKGHANLGTDSAGKARDSIDIFINSRAASKDYTPPKKMYHVTTKDRLQSILQNGLVFGSPRASSSGEIRGVYLTENPFDDMGLGGDISGFGTDDQVVLEVDTEGLQLRFDPEFAGSVGDLTSAKEYVQAVSEGKEPYALYNPGSIPASQLKLASWDKASAGNDPRPQPTQNSRQQYDAIPAPAAPYFPGGSNTYLPKFDKTEVGFTRLSRGQDPTQYITDASGHEHKGKGPGGGQFTPKGQTGNSVQSQSSSQPQKGEPTASPEQWEQFEAEKLKKAFESTAPGSPYQEPQSFQGRLRKKTPTVGYHTTPGSNLASISKIGLIPRASSTGGGDAGITPGVYFSDREQEESMEDSNPETEVALRVKIPKGFKAYDDTEVREAFGNGDDPNDVSGPAAFFVPWRIPPENIEVYINGQWTPLKSTPTQNARGENPTTYKDGPHKFGCVMAPLQGQAAIELLSRANLVRDCDLADDGRETEPHVTVRYGFHDDVTTNQVQQALRGKGPFELTLGKVSCFYGEDSGKDYDVVKVDVTSPQLRAMNSILGRLPCTDSFKDYNPHATIAYVQKGKGKDYAKLLTPLDLTVTVDELEFSDPAGQHTFFKLYGLRPVNESVKYVKDAQGHEHKGKGPGGGQFTSDGQGEVSSPPIQGPKTGRIKSTDGNRPVEEWSENDVERLVEPVVKDGLPNECYENARREYLARKEAGESVKYVVGTLFGKPAGDKWFDESKKATPVPHAWVETEDGEIVDPTPFKYGMGDYKNLPQRPAQEEFEKVLYVGEFSPPDSALIEPLKNFPSTSTKNRSGRKSVRYTAAHAPAGGVTVAGKKFTGGQFIPSDVMAEATPEEKAKVEGAQTAGSSSQASLKNDKEIAKAFAGVGTGMFGTKPNTPLDEDGYDDGRDYISRSRMRVSVGDRTIVVDRYGDVASMDFFQKDRRGSSGHGWTAQADDLQPGTMTFVRTLTALAKEFSDNGFAIKASGVDPQRNRLYAKVLTKLGLKEGSNHTWRKPESSETPSLVSTKPEPISPVTASVLSRLPRTAYDRLSSRVTKVTEAPTVEAVTDAWYAGEPGYSGKRTPCYGFYDPTTGELVTGPGGPNVDQRGVLAHEIGHALDQSDDRRHFDLSGHPEFLSAWQAEMGRGQLSRYAATDEVEGFAEFCRLLYGTDDGMERAAREFPRSYGYFKRVGLVG